jgi:hypothetical protein
VLIALHKLQNSLKQNVQTVDEIWSERKSFNIIVLDILKNKNG